ncbi:MAG: TetR/AcrR family transcriptional regulator [Acidobacteriota bacterium]
MTTSAEARNRILETAREHFFTLGFTKVTMDEMAHELGMSKKTLYQHFPGKKELLREALVGVSQLIAEGLDGIINNPQTEFPEKLELALGFVASELPRFSPLFLRDIQRHAPEIWQELDRRRSQSIKKYLGALIEEGIQKGMLRKDVDAEFLVLLFSTLILNIINPESLSRLPLSASQAFARINRVMFRGILTDKGRAQHHSMES